MFRYRSTGETAVKPIMPAILIGLISLVGFGQQFEVASIKPSNAGADSPAGMKTDNGPLHAVNVTLKRFRRPVVIQRAAGAARIAAANGEDAVEV